MTRSTMSLAPSIRSALAAGFALLVIGSSAAAPVKRSIDTSGGPYCGIYSLYGALKSLGIDVNFADLVQQKYAGAPFGSPTVYASAIER